MSDDDHVHLHQFSPSTRIRRGFHAPIQSQSSGNWLATRIVKRPRGITGCRVGVERCARCRFLSSARSRRRRFKQCQVASSLPAPGLISASDLPRRRPIDGWADFNTSCLHPTSLEHPQPLFSCPAPTHPPVDPSNPPSPHSQCPRTVPRQAPRQRPNQGVCAGIGPTRRAAKPINPAVQQLGISQRQASSTLSAEPSATPSFSQTVRAVP